jgi:hypothetical protein
LTLGGKSYELAPQDRQGELFGNGKQSRGPGRGWNCHDRRW